MMHVDNGSESDGAPTFFLRSSKRTMLLSRPEGSPRPSASSQVAPGEKKRFQELSNHQLSHTKQLSRTIAPLTHDRTSTTRRGASSSRAIIMASQASFPEPK
eukprot:scaffold556_cov221-Pinguiococcus_pyrenoidosus.AAC.5